MSTPLLCKYEVALKALMRMHPELDGVAPIAANAANWVQEFSSSLDMVFEAGARAGLDVGSDAQVAGFLQDIRGRLLHHANETWIDHSPQVVEGREEQLRQLAAVRTMPAPVASVIDSVVPAWLSPLPLDEFSRLVEYTKQVNEGSMSLAKFEEHKRRVLTTGPDGALAASPSLSVVPPPSSSVPSPLQSLVPSPVLSGASAPSPISAPEPALGLAPSSSQRPVHQATLAALAALATPESSSMRRFGVKCSCSEELMDISTLPDYVRCDFCTCNKVKCAPQVGSVVPYMCACCEDTKCLCVPPAIAPSRTRRKAVHAVPVPALVLPSTGPAGFLKTDAGVPPGTDKAAATLFWRTELVCARTTAEVANAHVTFVEQRYAKILGDVVAPGPSISGSRPKRVKVEKKSSVNVMADDEVVEVEGPSVVFESSMVAAGYPSVVVELDTTMGDAMSSATSPRVSLSSPDYPGNLDIAERALLLYGQTMVECLLWVKNVTEWLRRFYPLWTSVHAAASLSSSAVSHEAYKLVAKVKEWAVPYAAVEWLRLFPEVVEGFSDRLVLHSAIISNAQARVLNIWLLGAAASGNLPDMYNLADQELRDYYRTAVIRREEYVWHLGRLELGRLEASWEWLLARGSAVTQPGTLSMTEGTVVLDPASSIGRKKMSYRGSRSAWASRTVKAFELAQQSFIALSETWPKWPLCSQMVATWLFLFYHSWKNLEVLAEFANVPGVSERALTIRAEIEAEAQPYAELDWIQKFPRVVARDKDRLIQFYAILDWSYFSALFAAANFEYHRATGLISLDDFDWYQAKLDRIKLDFILEQEHLARVTAPSSASNGSANLQSGAVRDIVVMRRRVDSVPPAYAVEPNSG
ncbi:hypothetical protein H4582DRAFT_2058754 [Lactarius indigo]|nr:hypothetical protein H4582DRAFT_2058754 [Lactarius indigo]